MIFISRFCLASKKLQRPPAPGTQSRRNFRGRRDCSNSPCRKAPRIPNTGLQFLLIKMRSEMPPQALLEDIVTTVQDPFLGLEALALASICERSEFTPSSKSSRCHSGVAETPEAKVALARAWLRCWRNYGFWLSRMPSSWWKRPRTGGRQRQRQEGQGKIRCDGCGHQGQSRAQNLQ